MYSLSVLDSFIVFFVAKLYTVVLASSRHNFHLVQISIRVHRLLYIVQHAIRSISSRLLVTLRMGVLIWFLFERAHSICVSVLWCRWWCFGSRSRCFLGGRCQCKSVMACCIGMFVAGFKSRAHHTPEPRQYLKSNISHSNHRLPIQLWLVPPYLWQPVRSVLGHRE